MRNVEIKVIGSGCPDCNTLYTHTLEALQRLGLEAHVEKVEDLVEMVKLGVMQVPTLMVDGTVRSAGRVLTTEQVCKLLKD